MTIVRYLNPRNDIAFKKIFGTEKNKDILKHFLNDIIVVGDKKPIKEVTLLNPMLHPEAIHKKQSIVDVLCEDEDGVKYIVEMQVAKVGGFEKRAQYYAAKTYASQPDEGDEYQSLKEVIFLAITEYEMFPKKKDYKSVHVVLDDKTYETDLKDFSFTFLELPKFKKSKEELESYEEKWCYFLKHADDAEDMDELIRESEEVIKKAYDELKTHNWSNAELTAYEASEKSARDARARESYVREEAREEGRLKGILEGRLEGEKMKALAIAKKMLFEGISDKNMIAKITGLDLADIEKLI